MVEFHLLFPFAGPVRPRAAAASPVRRGRSGVARWRRKNPMHLSRRRTGGMAAPDVCTISRQDPMNREDGGRGRRLAEPHASVGAGLVRRIWNKPLHLLAPIGRNGVACKNRKDPMYLSGRRGDRSCRSEIYTVAREDPMYLSAPMGHADHTRTQHPCSSVFICGSTFFGTAHGMGKDPMYLSAAASCRRKRDKTP